MLQYPIVGSRHRKPADEVLNALPGGAQLTLVPEPYNEFDTNAISVWVYMPKVEQTPMLTRVLNKYAEVLLNVGNYQLGYLPREAAKYLKHERRFPDTNVDAKLVFPFGSSVAYARFDDPGGNAPIGTRVKAKNNGAH